MKEGRYIPLPINKRPHVLARHIESFLHRFHTRPTLVMSLALNEDGVVRRRLLSVEPAAEELVAFSALDAFVKMVQLVAAMIVSRNEMFRQNGITNLPLARPTCQSRWT